MLVGGRNGFFNDNQAAMPGASQLILSGAEQESYQKNHNSFFTSGIKNISGKDWTKKKASKGRKQ